MTSTLTAAAGWIGAVALLAGYLQVSRGRWSGTGIRFQGCAVVGSGGLGVAAAAAEVWSSALLNLGWLVIGMVALARRGDGDVHDHGEGRVSPRAGSR